MGTMCSLTVFAYSCIEPRSAEMKSLNLSSDINRLVILGDPHGDLAGVEKVYEIEERADTFICCVGDVVGYADGPASSRLCRFFEGRGTPTVEGNHEDWVRPSGRLAIVTEGNESKLSREAHAWIKNLPESIRLARDDGEVMAIITHSIRDRGWDWINQDNAHAFVKTLGSPRLVFAGHSHRPKFITISGDNGVSCESFDFREADSFEKAVPKIGTLLIDTGSIGRPEATERANTKLRHDGRRFGTYAVVDIGAERVSLRRIVKVG